MTSPADDEKFMARAIEVARRHLGLTDTNPSVGCVIVKDGNIVAEASTSVSGRPHAERNALALAGEAALGATAYVTLEPCSHYGKTPPCANALVEAGVARVVVAVDDPDERVSGRGYQILRDAGIQVETGLLRDEAQRGLAGYLIRKTKNRPQVILKLAVSSDGKIGREGEGQIAITGPEARQAVQTLRAECDAILVGIGTVLADDPELTVRIPGMEDRSPIRVVLDRNLQIPTSSKLVRTARDVPVIVVTSNQTARADEAWHLMQGGLLAGVGVELLDAVGLASLLHSLGERGMSNLLVEGGAAVARSFLEAGLVDRILLFEGPDAIGAGGVETPLARNDMPKEFTFVGETAFGADRCFEYERPL
ncbi:diaminohydroxyphosphoribosylaminopyrimidine deaminase/5-amino-6-(5-phosphoribosylamino)uracil reductase [Rhizobium sp. BIGb0125]|uniref:bifunctional diaminohydroxyphosphoribosylaminopyrimidine deaminase/5-amino-6-(5-phosphoribosylamino)uracil reductase RibD n=1 Tax=Rhizobium sp. BIGb0125 TaxID=2940618 RepID=UPI002168AD0A|nr:bifunctional diaminohydroxyphosphoribosylaminopyrimidine deaminase/5-amino-6-(5-phosphoribosylamino)uracil reductase RibD [Rhizobium sp. BIGb0125]MCS4241621.1 diaminohydroxyphosphoribosylaminopyrimidine deaminase/5-amino-6-(5-phosphoribosylamino)uracil reductase [Rhizobium sp. BIGb0125]